MRAAILEAYNSPLVLADVELGSLLPNEVLVQTVAAGVCHTDRSVQSGAHGSPMPNILGHEAAGVVMAVGDAVTDVVIGDHVVACPSGFCGKCEWCLRGLSYMCTDKGRERAAGLPPRVRWRDKSVVAMSGVGAFAEELLLHERAVVRIPEQMPLELAALLGCGVLTGVGSVFNMAKVSPGQTVAVIGIGGVGLNVVQACRLAGARRIIAIDRMVAKLDRALLFGATDVLDAGTTDIVEGVRALTGDGVDHAFEVVGRSDTIEAAFGMLRVRGTATVVGVPRPDSLLSLSPMGLFGERRLQGSNMGSANARLDIPMLADLYLGGRLLLDELVSARILLEDINSALDTMDDSTGARSIVVFD